MTDAELAAIINRKQVERFRRALTAARRRAAYESEHQRKLREAGART